MRDIFKGAGHSGIVLAFLAILVAQAAQARGWRAEPSLWRRFIVTVLGRLTPPPGEPVGNAPPATPIRTAPVASR